MSGPGTTKAVLAVFVSGGGTNLQALIDATRSGILSARIGLVVSSNPSAFALKRAENHQIPALVWRPGDFPSPSDAERALVDALRTHSIDTVALAGYLKLIPASVVQAFRGRMVNVHPALLPKYGGKGMYGRNVHEAVLAAGEKVTGPTFHFVDEKYDHGRILEQIELPVHPDDTPDSLATRVQNLEYKYFPRVIERLISGEFESTSMQASEER